jgi:hypothetical protein
MGRNWNWGQDVDLRRFRVEVGYRRGRHEILGVYIGFRLTMKTNFVKLLDSFKKNLISWGNNRLSLVEIILVANQVLLSLMWYFVMCWNPNARMITQNRGVIRNFISREEDRKRNAPRSIEPSSMTPPLRGGLRFN